MIGLLPLFPSSVYHFILDEDTSELDPRGFEFIKQNTAAASKNIRVLEEYPKTKKIILNKFKEIAKNPNFIKIAKNPAFGNVVRSSQLGVLQKMVQ